jgi:ABC-type transporter Mla subunit MlaD
MALQDLTPRLRTRLNQMEVAVGLFVAMAALLLLAGTGYYLKHTAQRKGWLVAKAKYYTFLRTAAGIRVGDPVKLMGRDVGEITRVDMMPADDQWSREQEFNVYVEFVVREPYYGYLWVDSRAKINASDLLGNRAIELTRGVDGLPTYRDQPARSIGLWTRREITEIYNAGEYHPVTPQTKGFWLLAVEAPTFNDRAEALLNKVEAALPNILSLTNKLNDLLDNGTTATSHLDDLLTETRPTLDNLREITEMIKEPQGGLGEWLFPTNISGQLSTTLGTADTTLQSVDQKLTTVSSNLNVSLQSLTTSLDNLSEITGNLNRQVQLNPEMLSQISAVVTNTDSLVQGLKKHWFFRSAFKKKK